MENIETFVKNKLDKNKLDLNLVTVLSMINSYKSVYNTTEEKMFFHYIMNEVGYILNKYSNSELETKELELLGWLRIKGSDKTKIIYFEYETDDEFYQWLQYRLKYYERINNINEIRLINYLELSTINFIQDITTNSSYVLKKHKCKDIHILKTGYGTDQDNLSFIKYISSKFNDGYIFIPKI